MTLLRKSRMCLSKALVLKVRQGHKLLIWISALGELSGLSQPGEKDMFIQILEY